MISETAISMENSMKEADASSAVVGDAS